MGSIVSAAGSGVRSCGHHQLLPGIGCYRDAGVFYLPRANSPIR